MGAKPVTLSDSDGYIFDESGITKEKLAFIMELKNVRRGRMAEYAEKYPEAVFSANVTAPPLDHNPLWNHKAECAFPSATQNEISAHDAANMLRNGVYVVCEGANMPTENAGIEHFLEAGILFGPGKAANAGGVATSGLGNGAEQHAHVVDARRGGRKTAKHHAGDSSDVPRDRGAIRHAGKLCERSEHRGLPKSRECDDGSGRGLTRLAGMSKSECRSSKQIRITKWSEKARRSFGHSNFDHCFGFRVSDFGFIRA